MAPPSRPCATQGERKGERAPAVPVVGVLCTVHHRKIRTVRFLSPQYFQGTLMTNLRYIDGCHINESVWHKKATFDRLPLLLHNILGSMEL